jgi:hypothetical protein
LIIKDIKIKCQEHGCDFKTSVGMGVMVHDWENKSYYLKTDAIPEILEHTDKTGHTEIVVSIPENQEDLT